MLGVVVLSSSVAKHELGLLTLEASRQRNNMARLDRPPHSPATLTHPSSTYEEQPLPFKVHSDVVLAFRNIMSPMAQRRGLFGDTARQQTYLLNLSGAPHELRALTVDIVT